MDRRSFRLVFYPIRTEDRALFDEATDHVMLVGEGATRFALEMGFEKRELLTPASRQKWLRWKACLNPRDNWLDHDDDVRIALPQGGEGARWPSGSGPDFCSHEACGLKLPVTSRGISMPGNRRPGRDPGSVPLRSTSMRRHARRCPL